ncbi:MAG: hypothetical protein ACOC4Z_02105 [Patescibacteria group bacterium]
MSNPFKIQHKFANKEKERKKLGLFFLCTVLLTAIFSRKASSINGQTISIEPYPPKVNQKISFEINGLENDVPYDIAITHDKKEADPIYWMRLYPENGTITRTKALKYSGKYTITVEGFEGETDDWDTVAERTFTVAETEVDDGDTEDGDGDTGDKTTAGREVETGLGTIPTDPGELVSDIVEFATKLAGAAALLLLIFGGIKLIASQGDYEAIEDARKTITAAITGLLVVIFAVLLLRLIGYDILNLPGWEPGGIIDIS